jgi:conjugal transfer pilus assembly protein TraE
MELSNLSKTWNGINHLNDYLKILLLISIISNVILVIAVLSKSHTVVLVPSHITENLEVSKNKSSGGYKKAWALFATQLIGNVSPGNAEFVKEQFSGLLASDVRIGVMDQITRDLTDLKSENVSSIFEIESVMYEPDSDKVFVTGKNKLKSTSGGIDGGYQTYEYVIAMEHYTPYITAFNVYAGQPRTQDRLLRESEVKKTVDEQLNNQ